MGLLQESVGDDEDVRRHQKPGAECWQGLISDLELEPPAVKRAARAARAPAEVDLAEGDDRIPSPPLSDGDDSHWEAAEVEAPVVENTAAPVEALFPEDLPHPPTPLVTPPLITPLNHPP